MTSWVVGAAQVAKGPGGDQLYVVISHTRYFLLFLLQAL